MEGTKVVIYGLSTEGYAIGCQMAIKGADVQIIDEYLVKKNLIKRKTNPNEIVSAINQFFAFSDKNQKKRVKATLKTMEDPYKILTKTIKSISK